MGKVTKRDLNQNTASVLQQVTETNDLVVTEHGKPKWRITAYRPPEEPLKRMELDGRYTPPIDDPSPWPSHPAGPRYSDAEVEELLDEMRGAH